MVVTLTKNSNILGLKRQRQKPKASLQFPNTKLFLQKAYRPFHHKMINLKYYFLFKTIINSYFIC